MFAKQLLAGVVGLCGATLLSAADAKLADYTELSKLIHQAVVEKAPKVYEDRSEWGKTIPAPDVVRFPRLKRVMIQNGDRMEVPDGTWKRTKVWLDDPSKNIQIQVRELKKLEGKNYRLVLDATVALHGERERKIWRNGIHLVGLSVQADALIGVSLDCDVAVTINAAKFPPEVTVEPKIVESRLDLKEFDLNRVGIVEGDLPRDIGNELKGILQELIKLYEPEVKERANVAIAKAIKEGKGTISATKLFKLDLPVKPKE